MTDNPKTFNDDTVGHRLAFALSLAQGPSLRDLDRWCSPRPLGLGHASKIAKGEIVDPSVSTVDRLATVLGCSFEWLATGRGHAPRPGAVKRALVAAQMRKASAGGGGVASK